MLVTRSLLVVVAAVGLITAGDGGDGDDGDRFVRLTASAVDDEGSPPAPIVDRLVGDDVLDVAVSDGEADARGHVTQCRRTPYGFTGCINRYPVQFGDRGDARFQYRLVDPGRCAATDACVLVVADGDGDGARRAVARLVFNEAAPPPPIVSITTPGPVVQGDEVRVDIVGAPPAADVQVAYCRPRCAATTRVVADADGNASVAIKVGEPCAECRIAVIVGVHEASVDVPFAAAPRPRYDPRRVAVAAVVALALLIIAGRIWRSTDWAPPSEAATPELDAIDL
jgi:hypothetical protein